MNSVALVGLIAMGLIFSGLLAALFKLTGVYIPYHDIIIVILVTLGSMGLIIALVCEHRATCKSRSSHIDK